MINVMVIKMNRFFEVKGIAKADSNKVIDEAINMFLNSRITGSTTCAFGQPVTQKGEELFVKYSKSFNKIKIVKGDTIVTPAGFFDIEDDDYSYMVDEFVSAFEKEYGKEDLKWQLENIREEFIFIVGYIWWSQWATETGNRDNRLFWILGKKATNNLIKKSIKFLHEVMVKSENYIKECMR